jgi:hypothetical protein
MSFEGYVMTVCARGHLLEEGYDYSGSDHTKTCEVCGAAWVWSYTVDLTNDSGVKPVLGLYRPGSCDLDDDVYYLPVDAATAPDHPVKAVQWIDSDHPDDGSFATEKEAWKNKDRRYTELLKRNKHETWKNRH